VANSTPNFYVNLPFYTNTIAPEGILNDHVAYFKYSYYTISTAFTIEIKEMCLMDTYAFLYRGHWFDSFSNSNNYYTKNIGYIKSKCFDNSKFINQGSVNIQYKINTTTVTLGKEQPVALAKVYAANGDTISSNYEDTVYVTELANNQISYILDYRQAGQLYKDPRDVIANAVYPLDLTINASLKYAGKQFSYCYNNFGSNSIISTTLLGTHSSKDFIKQPEGNHLGGVGLFNRIYWNGFVNLTSVFLDLILKDEEEFPRIPFIDPDPLNTGLYFQYVARHFDFDIKITEERIGDLLLLDVQFLNIMAV
jgi:hypothetical protein